MKTPMPSIPIREVLHFLGWRGSPIEESVLLQIHAAIDIVRSELDAYVVTKRFALDADLRLSDSIFLPKGNDIRHLLKDSREAVLMAATLGARSERLLLRYQARSSADALIMDAALSAAIEAVCDEQEHLLREEYGKSGLHLTDRFSPGYGDMPIEQTKEICAVLQTEKTIGLTVSHSGIMIPRKSVTAMIGVNRFAQERRPSACAICSMRETCALRISK